MPRNDAYLQDPATGTILGGGDGGQPGSQPQPDAGVGPVDYVPTPQDSPPVDAGVPGGGDENNTPTDDVVAGGPPSDAPDASVPTDAGPSVELNDDGVPTETTTFLPAGPLPAPPILGAGSTTSATLPGGAGVSASFRGGERLYEPAVATTREVQPEELVANQLDALLASDSPYIQSARRQGMAMSNARGGLGGTLGIGASVQAAIRQGLPIAQADAQAFRDAAVQNMNALNQFALANLEAAVNLDVANIGAESRIQAASLAASAQVQSARISAAARIATAELQAETQMRIVEYQGELQQYMADVVHAQTLEQIALTGEYNLADTQIRADSQWDVTQMTLAGDMVTRAWDARAQSIISLDGIEMDDNARQAAYQSIEDEFAARVAFIERMFGVDFGIEFDDPDG